MREVGAPSAPGRAPAGRRTGERRRAGRRARRDAVHDPPGPRPSRPRGPRSSGPTAARRSRPTACRSRRVRSAARGQARDRRARPPRSSPDGATIAIGSGSTALAFARELADRAPDGHHERPRRRERPRWTETGIELIVLGGVVRPAMHSMLGHLAELATGELRADMARDGRRGAINPEQGVMKRLRPPDPHGPCAAPHGPLCASSSPI